MTTCDVCGVLLAWIDVYLAGGPPPVADLQMCEACFVIDVQIEAGAER